MKFYQTDHAVNGVAMPKQMIRPEEIEIIGKWIKAGDRVIGDEARERVHQLLENGYLKKIGKDWSGWETLFRDPNYGRYWERTYPQGYLHGGGPPALFYLPDVEAKTKYRHLFTMNNE